MSKSKTKMATPTTSPRPRSNGTAILGVVIPELAVCGVFDVTDEQANYIAKGITTAILANFNMELLQASGMLGNSDQY